MDSRRERVTAFSLLKTPESSLYPAFFGVPREAYMENNIIIAFPAYNALI